MVATGSVQTQGSKSIFTLTTEVAVVSSMEPRLRGGALGQLTFSCQAHTSEPLPPPRSCLDNGFSDTLHIQSFMPRLSTNIAKAVLGG